MIKVFSLISVCILHQTQCQERGYYQAPGRSSQYGHNNYLNGPQQDGNTATSYNQNSLSRFFKPRPAQLDEYIKEMGNFPAGSENILQQNYGQRDQRLRQPTNQYSNGNTYYQPRRNVQNGYSNSFNKKSSYEDEDSYSEPASYEFSYLVIEPQYGIKFGHQEKREGDVARGLYHVLLPDGRTQLVEYTADKDGYKPRITYKEENRNTGYRYKKSLV